MLLLGLAGVVEALHLSSLRNPAIWVHLRLGEWILANKTWPTTALFTQVPSLAWHDLAWAPDTVLAIFARILGLSAVPALWMVYRLLLAAVTFLLAGGARENFWVPGLLSAVAQYVLFSCGPVEAGISTLLFAVLLLLLKSRSANSMRRLVWFAVLFAVWANSDSGFVYGVALVALFSIALTLKSCSFATASQSQAQIRNVMMLPGVCFLASLLSPYGLHAYGDFFAAQTDSANAYLAARQTMNFHQPQDYALLLLIMAAFLTLGIRRSRDAFLIAMLAGCTAFSFYAQGENWLATLASLAVIGAARPTSDLVAAQAERAGWHELLPAAATSAALLLLVFVLWVPHRGDVVLNSVTTQLPVRACDYIRGHQLPAPLFNEYLWGSFLVWYLPEYPVAIDARSSLYSEESESGYFRVMKVDMPFQAFAPMNDARTLLLAKPNVLGDALRTLPQFQVVYEDDISMVLLRNENAANREERADARALN